MKKLVFLFTCALLTACQSFHPGEIYHHQASSHPAAITGDSVSVLVRMMDGEESRVAFDYDVFSENIQPLIVSISNHSSVPLRFDGTALPSYISADEVYRRVHTSPATILLGGIAGAAITPVVAYGYALADSNITEPKALISPTAFSISGALWGIGTLFCMIDLSTDINPRRQQYLNEVSIPLLTIAPGEDAQTIVFTNIPEESEHREVINNAQTLGKIIIIELTRPTGEVMIFEVPPVF